MISLSYQYQQAQVLFIGSSVVSVGLAQCWTLAPADQHWSRSCHVLDLVSLSRDLNADGTSVVNNRTWAYNNKMHSQALILYFVSFIVLTSSKCQVSHAEVGYHDQTCSQDIIVEAVELAESCQCQPRQVVVQLPWPNNTDVHHMTPTHVEVKTN